MGKEGSYRQVLLAIVICFFILALPAFLRCTNSPGTKFTPSDLFFENPDQEGRQPDGCKSEIKVFRPTGLSISFLPEAGLSQRSPDLFRRPLSLRQETSVLRC